MEKKIPPAPNPLPVAVIDSHTHFDLGTSFTNLQTALAAAEAVGVKGAVQVGCDLESSRYTLEAVKKDKRLLGAVALHPNEVPKLASAGKLYAALAEIETIAEHERIRAIGETGLDYFRTGEDGVLVQQEAFRLAIGIAKRKNLALQIHDRDAHADVVRILEEEGAPARTVFHCFSGDAHLAKKCAEEGWYLSFSGTLTFKNAQYLQEALLCADLERILVETDAPFLTPHPYRGYVNASYMLPHTVRMVAEVLQLDLAKLCQQLVDNTENVFGKWV